MDSLRERLEREVAGGRVWRAREIFRGTIAYTWPPDDAVERYGQILLSVGDQMEAGKYLWLSGARRAEYEDAIALFLGRHDRHGGQDLLPRLPRSIRWVAFAKLPDELRRDLTARGIPPGAFGITDRKESAQGKASTFQAIWMGSFMFGVVVSLFVGAFVTLKTIVGWIARLAR